MFLSCALLQSDTPPPVPNATWGSREKAEDAVDGSRPEPETILQVCQAQVAELEQWLDKTKVSLGSDHRTPKMQQMVELQLADYQVRWSGQFAAAIQTNCPSLGCVSAEKLCLLLLGLTDFITLCRKQVTTWPQFQVQLSKGLVKIPGFRVENFMHLGDLGGTLEYF